MGFYLNDQIEGKIAAIKRLRSLGLNSGEIWTELNPKDMATQVTATLIDKVLGSIGSVSENTCTDKQLLNEGS